MRIENISIRNFKNFGDTPSSFELNPHFTVIIGINGKGKTSILHAIRILAGCYLLDIPVAKSRHINSNEIRQEAGKYLAYKTPVELKAKGYLEENILLNWSRQILLNKTKTTGKADDLKILGKTAYQNSNEQKNFKADLPVLAYFGTARLMGGGRDTRKKKPRMGREIFIEGYYDWFELKSSTFQYTRWLSSYDRLLKEDKEYKGTKEAFLLAIQSAVPYIQKDGIRFEEGELWLSLDIEGEKQGSLPLSLCSDGIQSFVGMVAELAFRCIVLNAHHEELAVKKSRGIVMIDELDLHLHPNWQRTVVSDLKLAFPLLQFIATTHSPFIVQSLRSNELINLDKPVEVEPYKQGLEEVSEDIMQVENAPRSKYFLKMEETAKKYFELLAKAETVNEKEKTELKAQLDELLIPFYEEPAFVAKLKMEKLAKIGK